MVPAGEIIQKGQARPSAGPCRDLLLAAAESSLPRVSPFLSLPRLPLPPCSHLLSKFWACCLRLHSECPLCLISHEDTHLAVWRRWGLGSSLSRCGNERDPGTESFFPPLLNGSIRGPCASPGVGRIKVLNRGRHSAGKRCLKLGQTFSPQTLVCDCASAVAPTSVSPCSQCGCGPLARPLVPQCLRLSPFHQPEHMAPTPIAPGSAQNQQCR